MSVEIRYINKYMYFYLHSQFHNYFISYFHFIVVVHRLCGSTIYTGLLKGKLNITSGNAVLKIKFWLQIGLISLELSDMMGMTV